MAQATAPVLDSTRRAFVTLLGGAIPVAESPAGYVDRILRDANPTQSAMATA